MENVNTRQDKQDKQDRQNKQEQKKMIIDSWYIGDNSYREIANIVNEHYGINYWDSERTRDVIRKYKKRNCAIENKDKIVEDRSAEIIDNTNNVETIKEIATIAHNNNVNGIDNKIFELKKERIKLQTEKLSLNQLLREQARFELFVEKAIDAINNIQIIDIPKINIIPRKTNRSGMLIFSDAHYGKELEIKGLKGEILNKYSPEIFEERMWKLLEETIIICNKQGFNSIFIFSLGDELEGMLRISQLMNLKYGVIESTIRYSNFIANWLNKLSEYVYIDFYSTFGNHTDLRLLDNKKGTFPHENMGRVIDELVKALLIGNKNIKMNSSCNGMIYTDIEGYGILGIHGEEKNFEDAIRDYQFMYGEKINYLIHGHKHHNNSINLGYFKGIIGTGSIIGIDDYSMKLKKMSSPSSKFVVFEKRKGIVEYNIELG
jgi:hypothetical protein